MEDTPRHYGPWEQFASLLTEGLVAAGHHVTLFATADSITTARLHATAPSGWSEDETIDTKVAECLHIASRRWQRHARFLQGILPDLFREGQGVVAEGALSSAGGVFKADTVLAKHDENYMPREVADALKKQGHWKDDYGAKPDMRCKARGHPGSIAVIAQAGHNALVPAGERGEVRS